MNETLALARELFVPYPVMTLQRHCYQVFENLDLTQPTTGTVDAIFHSIGHAPPQ